MSLLITRNIIIQANGAAFLKIFIDKSMNFFRPKKLSPPAIFFDNVQKILACLKIPLLRSQAACSQLTISSLISL